MFEKLVRPQNRNSLASIDPISMMKEDVSQSWDEGPDDATTDTPKAEQSIPADVREALRARLPNDLAVPSKAVITNRANLDGVSYTSWSLHDGNSGVLCQDIPFSIESILTFPEHLGGTYFVVRRHQDAGVLDDPYEKYPLLRAKLWSPKLDPDVEILHTSEIDAQFAKCVVQWRERKVAVIVSLSRVRSISLQLIDF